MAKAKVKAKPPVGLPGRDGMVQDAAAGLPPGAPKAKGAVPPQFLKKKKKGKRVAKAKDAPPQFGKPKTDKSGKF